MTTSNQARSERDGDRGARQPNSQGCFICGLANPIGLKMVFYEDRQANQVRAALSVSEA